MKINDKYKFVEKKLFNLWKLDKELYVLYNYNNENKKELLKLKCVLDERQEKYFYFEKLDYMFNIRLFNKKKWLVMTKIYKKNETKLNKIFTIKDLVKLGRLRLDQALNISKILKDNGYNIPILENNKLKK